MTYTISFHNEIMFSFNFVITERKCMNISPVYTVFQIFTSFESFIIVYNNFKWLYLYYSIP